MDPLKIKAEWYGRPVIVAGSGPSLTLEVARKVRFTRWLEHWKVLAINDAYKVMPWADALYACDSTWWQAHKFATDFEGMKFTSTSNDFTVCDDKQSEPAIPGVRLIGAKNGTGFSQDPQFIHYGGDNATSGFQAINLALLMGAKCVVLVGFDYGFREGKSHFFGDHQTGLRQFGESAYLDAAKAFDGTTYSVPIINATPDSRVTAFKRMALDEAIARHGDVPRNWPEPDAAADRGGQA